MARQSTRARRRFDVVWAGENVLNLRMMIWGLDTMTLVLSSGAMLIGYAARSQAVVQDILAGIVLRRMHFSPGDIIEFGGGLAWIENAGLLNFALISRDHRRQVVSNRGLRERFGTRRRPSWHEIVIRIPVDDQPERTRTRLVSNAGIVSEVMGILSRRPALGIVEEAEERALVLKARAWINDSEEGVDRVRSDLHHEGWERLTAAGMGLPVTVRSRPTIH